MNLKLRNWKEYKEEMEAGERKGRFSIISHLLAAGTEKFQILKVT